MKDELINLLFSSSFGAYCQSCQEVSENQDDKFCALQHEQPLKTSD
jgi:hypothetical protein